MQLHHRTCSVHCESVSLSDFFLLRYQKTFALQPAIERNSLGSYVTKLVKEAT